MNGSIQGEKIVQESSENESELDDSETEIEEIQTTTVTDYDESDKHDSEADSVVYDSEPTAETLFSTTRSGRIAGNWRLSEYFGK